MSLPLFRVQYQWMLKVPKKKNKKKGKKEKLTVIQEQGGKKRKLKKRTFTEEPEVLEPEIVDDAPQEIKVYPKQKCVIPDCTNLAVGKSDRCKQCGGNPIVEENLIDDTNPDNLPSLFAQVYKPEFHPLEYVRLAMDGKSEVEIAREFGVGVRTMRNWAAKFKMFAQAYEMGSDFHEAWWVAEGKANLKNRSYNTGLFKFLTGNKLGWSEKHESKNLNVNAGVLLAPKPMTKQQWEAEHAEED